MLYRRMLVVGAAWSAFGLASTAAIGCGPSGGEAPVFVGLEDQHGFVGTEIFFEVRASDAELSTLTFDMSSGAPSAATASLVAAGNGAGSSALFRWTPNANDIGVWIFDFEVSDGVHRTVESIAIEVNSIEGGAPVFRQPLGAGTTLDLTQSSCLTLSVLVEDPDSTNVQITQDSPVISGATLSETEDGTVWEWCPSSEQISSGDSFVLALAADDGEHLTVKHFVIVLRNVPLLDAVDLGGFSLHQAGATCSFQLPEPLEIERGNTVVIARDATRGEFESFWQTTLPLGTVFINAADACPRINGDESFVLNDSGGGVVDGPTPLMLDHENLQRVDGTTPPGSFSSWTFNSDDDGLTTPGKSPGTPLANAVYISEISDAPGTGTFVFEFVEIAAD